MKRFLLSLMATLTFAAVMLSPLFVPTSSLAADAATPQPTCGTVKTSIDYGCTTGTGGPIFDFVRAIIKFLGGLVGIVVVLMLIIGGIQYITSTGNPGAVAAAKNRIVNALIGLVLYLLMFAVLNFLIPGGIFA